MKFELTQEYLKEILDYNPKTGELTWLKNRQKRLVGREAGCIGFHGYRRISIQYKKYFTHRLAWLFVYGGSYGDVTIDHIDRNKLNNSIDNLRESSRSENCANIGLRRTNTSGYVGIVYVPGERKAWKAQIRHNRKRFLVGYFLTPEEAAKARDKKALELFGEYAYTNFPREDYLAFRS